MKIEFNSLPVDVQNEVKNDLKRYEKTNVTYESGRYNVSPSVVLKRWYDSDFMVIGTYMAKDVFTVEERIVNYVEAFHSFPCDLYKASREDYMLMNEVGNDWSVKFKLDKNGRIARA